MKARPLSSLDSPLMTVQDVAGLFSVHERTVFVWIANGRLPPPLRISQRILRWKREDVMKLLEQAKTA